MPKAAGLTREMAVPMSFAGVDVRLASINSMNAMTEQTKASKTKTMLPCQWVEEDGFEVILAQRSANDQQAPIDTAFLLKSRSLPRPTQSPNS